LDAAPDVFGGALDGGLRQAHPGRLFQQIGGLLEAVADAAGQGGEALGGGGQCPLGDAGAVVEGGGAFAAAAAVIVGAGVADGPDDADDGALAVGVIGGGVVAVGAGHTGGFV